MGDRIGIPLSAEDLVKYLDKLYPPKCPNIADNDRTIWMYAGKRELIDACLELYNLKEEDKNGRVEGNFFEK